MHYHVLIGLQGCYMPDENHVCHDLPLARAVAAEEIRRARDEGEKVSTRLPGELWFVGPYNKIALDACGRVDCLCNACHEREAGPSGRCDDCYQEEN